MSSRPVNPQTKVTPLSKLAGVSVLVLGLGNSGLALARWCARVGATLTVADTREQPPQLAALREQLPQARFVSGALDATLLDGIQAIYRSPGLSPAQIAPLAQAAKKAGIPLGSELDLFVQALAELHEQQQYQPKLLAVTGTNGKTTVTALTGALLARAGLKVAVAGNIGPTLLDTLAARLDSNDLPTHWVIELSSFQLDGVQGFDPNAATVLNLSQDHLDWHDSFDAYAAAKTRVFGPHTLRVLNRDDARVATLTPAPGKSKSGKPLVTPWQTFGSDLPQRPGDYGLEQANGITWLVRALPSQDGPRARSSATEQELYLQRLMPAQALRIHGRHNALNALAALALAQSVNAPLAALLHGLRDYRGEPHRVQPIGILNEVEFFDDSKGTNVGATVAALQGLGAERRLVVILGGDGKGQDFSPLAPAVASFARAVVLIGRDAQQIRLALADSGVPLLAAQDMADAVHQAADAARSGDAVLMSPACASFDMFQNYGHRAQVFCDAVRALARQHGQELV